MKKLIALILVMLLVLSGCGQSISSTDNNESGVNNEQDANGGDSAGDGASGSAEDATFAASASDMFTDRDSRTEYSTSGSITIQLNGDSASCNSNKVEISGTKVTIKDEGTYIISGTLNDGMIVVNAEDSDKPQLVLNGVNITSKTSAPLYILEADKVFVTLQSGTTNTLANGGTFTAIDDNNIDAAVFSKQDLTFNGSGKLTVTSPAGHGIVSKDDLVFTSGTYTVTSASHGVDANDSVRITNATITVDAGKDGIHAENSDDATLGFVYIASGKLDIDAEGDGISAGSTLQVEGGTIDVTAGGGAKNASKQTSDNWGNFGGGMMPGGNRGGMGGAGNTGNNGSTGNTGNSGISNLAGGSSSTSTSEDSTSIKGLKAAGSVLINNGTITVDSADDALHSNSSITINGGTFNIASGDDGVHADDTLTITNGTIKITESYEGLEALHIAVSGGDISLVASDDGLNAAGGTDSSGFGGNRGGDQFGGGGRGGAGVPGGAGNTGGADTGNAGNAPGGMGGAGGMGVGSSSGGSIVVSGGKLNIQASGDGMDANGTLEISGGYTVVCGPNQGDTATLDYDTSGIISGGTFIGTGASGMAQTFSSSKQGVISVSVGNQSAGTKITLTDSNGKTVIEYTPELAFSVVILSTADMVTGQNYTINVGSSSGTFAAQ